MCSVSAMMDYGRTSVPVHQWTQPIWDQFKQIIERLDKLDADLNQPDCEDPAKAAWMREVEARLKNLEDHASPSVEA